MEQGYENYYKNFGDGNMGKDATNTVFKRNEKNQEL